MSVSAELVCSARGCRRPGTWALRWNNPRLHDPDRRKTWLACDDHRETLGSFLRVRGFLRETVPAEELADPATPATGSAPDPRTMTDVRDVTDVTGVGDAARVADDGSRASQ